MAGPIFCPGFVACRDDLKLSEKVVFGRIWAYTVWGKRRRCDARNDTLADGLGLAYQTVANAVSSLKSKGLVRRREEDGARVLIPVEPPEGEDQSVSLTGETSYPNEETLYPNEETVKKGSSREESNDGSKSGEGSPAPGGQEEMFDWSDVEENGSEPPAEDRFPSLSELPREDSDRNWRIYPDEFETCFEVYPPREGGNSKGDAYRAWRARVRDGFAPEYLLNKTKQYRAYCEATGNDGTRYVKQAATFWGPAEHFAQDWEEEAAQASASDADRKMAERLERLDEMFGGNGDRRALESGTPEGREIEI